jgi:hypothetical protein
MVLDTVTILCAATLATLYEMHTGPVAGARGFWHGTLIHGRFNVDPAGAACADLRIADHYQPAAAFVRSYAPDQCILHEQRLSVQACFTSGLLLTGALYLVHAGTTFPQHCADYAGTGRRFR